MFFFGNIVNFNFQSVLYVSLCLAEYSEEEIKRRNLYWRSFSVDFECCGLVTEPDLYHTGLFRGASAMAESQGRNQLCGVCDGDVAGRQSMECELCQAQFHLKCLNLTESVYKVWCAKDAICFICDECRSGGSLKQFKELKKQNDVTQQYIYKIDENIQSQSLVMGKIGKGMTQYSDNVKTAICKIRESNDSIADAIKSVNDGMQSIQEAVSDLSLERTQRASSMREIMAGMDSIKKAVEDLSTKSEGRPERMGISYASVVRSERAKQLCVIKPKREGQTQDATRDDVKRLIDPTKVDVSGIRAAGGGGVAVVCDSEAALSGVSEMVRRQMGEEYEVCISKAMQPRVRLFGLSERRESEELIDLLITQNHLCVTADQVRVLTMRESRRRNCFEALVELPPPAYNDLLMRGKAKISWDICHVFDGVDVRRCHLCYSYSHLASRCPENVRLCLRCGGKHEARNCESNRISCVNCSRIAERDGRKIPTCHLVTSKECPMYRRALQRLRERIGFQ